MANFRTRVIMPLVLCVAALASGCATNDPNLITASLGDTTFPEARQPFTEGVVQFSEGHYGLAIDAFAKTVEGDPKNPEAWLGLAASYDQTGRFDQADNAYEKVQQLVGPTPSVLNNLGYSYLLRGQFERSAETLAAAYRGDPGNPYILNNIERLNARLAALGKPPVPIN